MVGKKCIFIEGGASGAHSNALSIRCQEAFHKLLTKMGFEGRKPKLVACGSRANVLQAFCQDLHNPKFAYMAMWIDSEAPLATFTALESAGVESLDFDSWEHLAAVGGWKKPKAATNQQVLFMVTCMESWICADPDTLKSYYGRGFNEKRLPVVEKLELLSPAEILAALQDATKNCKARYQKGAHSYRVLEQLDPSALRALPSFRRTEQILTKKL